MDVSLEMNDAVVATQRCAGLSAVGAPAWQKDVLIKNMSSTFRIGSSVSCSLPERELWSLRT